MAPHPQHPNIECTECEEEGNRFMKHIDTQIKRVSAIGDEEVNHFGIFRCTKNPRHMRREAFDPDQSRA